jgi:hypothetical protein
MPHTTFIFLIFEPLWQTGTLVFLMDIRERKDNIRLMLISLIPLSTSGQACEPRQSPHKMHARRLLFKPYKLSHQQKDSLTDAVIQHFSVQKMPIVI